MKNSKSILLIGLAAVILGGAYVLINQPSASLSESQSPATPSPNSAAATQSPTQSASLNSGAYVSYEPGIIEKTSGTKILFFHAAWCEQCRALEADIKKNTIPAGTTIIKVDYDSNQALRKQYGVTLQTTLVKVDDQGGLLEKFVAYNEPTLKAVTDNLL